MNETNIINGIKILYEDENLIAASLKDYLQSLRTIPNWTRFTHSRNEIKRQTFVVHRLDKEVSGVILFAKMPAHKYINDLFADRKLKNLYRSGSRSDKRK